MELLMDHGAMIEVPEAAGSNVPSSAVNDCLHNGRGPRRNSSHDAVRGQTWKVQLEWGGSTLSRAILKTMVV